MPPSPPLPLSLSRSGTVACGSGSRESNTVFRYLTKDILADVQTTGTACWPCRQRKVKCDNKSPCDNCVRREHAQLCSYKPNRSAATKNSSSGPETPQSRKREHSPDEQDRRSLSNDATPDTGIRVFGKYASPSQTVLLSHIPILPEPDSVDASRYLGQNSIPALLREQASPNEPQKGVDTIRQDMRSILGLDNTAPFPLMSARHLDRLTQDISAELPSDREVMKCVGSPVQPIS